MWYLYFLFLLLCYVWIEPVDSASPFLLFTFPSSECTSGVFTEKTGTRLNVTTSASTTCSTRTISGTPYGGISINACPGPNTLATGPIGTVFDAYNTHHHVNISAEVWFSVTTPFDPEAEFNYTFVELSTHTNFIPEGCLPDDLEDFFSMGRQEVQYSLQLFRGNFSALSDYNIANVFNFGAGVLNSPGGGCENLYASSVFRFDSSNGFDPLTQSIGFNTTVMYKLMVTVEGSNLGMTTIFLGTSDGGIAQFASPYFSSLFRGVVPIKFKFFPDGFLRMGCSATDMDVQSSIMIHRVAFYNTTFDRAGASALFTG